MKELLKMIDGLSIKLRSWREEDIEKLTELRNDIMLQSQLLSRVRGSSIDETRQWLQQRSSSPNNLFFIVAGKDKDVPLGYIQFLDFDHIDQTVKLGICLSPEIQGKGIGHEVLSLAFKYLYNCWAVRKVILEVRDDNRGAINCYEKIGFMQCGKYSKHKYFDGKWHDLIIMEIFLDTLVKTE
jgi:RimJ/RimL family protein N-acetyltransferase